jgi:hypothetical protein
MTRVKKTLAVVKTGSAGLQGIGIGRMDRMEKPGGAGARFTRLGKNSDPLGANSEIARKLKQYYDDLVSDEIPDRFADLLSQLEKADPSKPED